MPKDPVAQAWRNAFWVRDRLREHGLELRVQPLLVFTRARVPEGLVIKGVPILSADRLPEVIAGAPAQTVPVDEVLRTLAPGKGARGG